MYPDGQRGLPGHDEFGVYPDGQRGLPGHDEFGVYPDGQRDGEFVVAAGAHGLGVGAVDGERELVVLLALLRCTLGHQVHQKVDLQGEEGASV